MGRYCPGSTIIHRLDPRTKILLTLLFMMAVYYVESYSSFLALFLFAAGTAYCMGSPLGHTARVIKPILYLSAFAVFSNVLFVQGTPILEHGILRNVSREGVDLSVKMFLRLLLLAGGSVLLTFTTSPLSLADGLEKLMSPLKRVGVPVHDCAMMLTLAMRFIPMVFEEAGKIIRVQSARSAGIDTGGPLNRIRSGLFLLVPLYVSTSRRGEALAAALDARCYRSGSGRVRMKPLEFSRLDHACAGAMLIFLSLLTISDYAFMHLV